jgi:hypothetical protein
MILTRGRWFIYYDIESYPRTKKKPYLISFEHNLRIDLDDNISFHNLTETSWKNEYASHYDKKKGHNCHDCCENRIKLKKNLCRDCFDDRKYDQHENIFSTNVFFNDDLIRIHIYDMIDLHITINNTDYHGYINHIKWYKQNKTVFHVRFAHNIWLIRDFMPYDILREFVNIMVRL